MRVPLFLAVTFGFSWSFGAAVLLIPADGSVGAMVVRTLLMVAFMFGPMVGAIVAQRAAGQAIFKPLGVAMSLNWWWLVAWFGPFAFAVLTLVVGLLLPGVAWSPDLSGFLDRLSGTVSDAQLEEGRRQLAAMPPLLLWLLVIGQPLVAGVSINAVAGFGEELGWRGFLFRAWAPFGFWKASLLVGVIWGVWHAPVIVQGHNYAQHPYIGVVMMTALCVLAAPPFAWLRLRTGSVIAVSVAHGTFNACGSLSIMFLRGGNDLLVGGAGLAGLLVLLLVNLALIPAVRGLGTFPDASVEPVVPRAGAAGPGLRMR